jgi:CrcB protein
VVVVLATDVVSTPYLRPLLGTGVCGALTTFSAIVVEVDRLIAHGHAGLATGYLLATVAAGLVAATAGMLIARLLTPRVRPDAEPEAA